MLYKKTHCFLLHAVHFNVRILIAQSTQIPFRGLMCCSLFFFCLGNSLFRIRIGSAYAQAKNTLSFHEHALSPFALINNAWQKKWKAFRKSFSLSLCLQCALFKLLTRYLILRHAMRRWRSFERSRVRMENDNESCVKCSGFWIRAQRIFQWKMPFGFVSWSSSEKPCRILQIKIIYTYDPRISP